MLKNLTLKLKVTDLIIALILIVCIAASTAVLCLLATNKSNVLLTIDYNELLFDPNAFDALSKNGFSKLNNLPSEYLPTIKTASIHDSCLLFSHNDKEYIYDGQNVFLAQGIRAETFKCGKYIFTNESKKVGLKSVNGNVLIDCVYDSIDFNENTAIAALNGYFDVFYMGAKLGTLPTRAGICLNPRFIVIDNGASNTFFDLESGFLIGKPFNPPILSNKNDFVLLSEPNPNGIFMFSSQNSGLIGYATSEKILVEPIFYTAKRFEENFSHASVYKNGELTECYLEYRNDEITITNLADFALNNAEIMRFQEDYAIYYDYTTMLYGLVDSSFNIVIKPTFKSVHKTIFNGLILNTELNRFYSIEQKDYISTESVLSVFNDFFVCFSLGKYAIYDINLKPLVQNCNFVHFFQNSNILIVATNSQIHRFNFYN